RPNFYPYMTAKENLELVCKIKGTSLSKVDEKLELVGLLERKNDKFRTYSLGMKQRLAIASALLNDPEILILDEPTNGLDPQGIHQIRDIIRLIASQGTTILLASHLLDEVEKVCSHVLVLRFGEILYNGKVDEMSNKSGYFELQSNDSQKLIEVLKNHPELETAKENEGKIIVYFKTQIDAMELNKYLFEKGIILNHLVKRKLSLEEQFLELTNQ
ncbi:MAG TPA: ABC transporter ATP-binding protein, partial [Flavobacterium sp.]|nr:ABC transporter ATP-binding protein [Flavobacterium sp.]